MPQLTCFIAGTLSSVLEVGHVIKVKAGRAFRDPSHNDQFRSDPRPTAGCTGLEPRKWV